MAYMVVYPRGNRSTLSTAYVQDYEKSDWDLASQREFDDATECNEYMRELARRHNLRCSGDTAYLD